ncbi:MAG TPA: hypothetical protein VK013_02265 [Myxococcaceae bacterium]|nr:hypothetical protein [Myxococcaceae bacterium]
MRAPWLISLLVGSVAFAAGPVAAPSAKADTRLGAPLLEQIASRDGELKVGDWVTYRISGGPGREAFWRFAIVAADRDGEGREGRWVEIDIGSHPNMVSPLSQLRMLMSRDQDGERNWKVRRVLMAHGTARPSEVDPAEVERLMGSGTGGGQGRASHPGARAVRGTPQRILTQAGSVQAEPVDLFYRGTRVRRIWMSPEIPVMGLAKIEIPGSGYTMEARDYGIGAEPMMVLPKPGTAPLSLEAIGVTPPNSRKENQP